MLLDLPDAVIDCICAQIADECILPTARSCKRLSERALRVFLARHEIPEPEAECEVFIEGDVAEKTAPGLLLQALQLATRTFLHSTEHLSLIFLNVDLSLGLRDLFRAASLVDRLSRVDRVSLEFRGTICEGQILTDARIQREWNARFSELWFAILRKGTVTDLSLRTKWDFLQGYELYNEESRLLARSQVAVKGILGKLRSAPKHGDLAASARHAMAQLSPNRSRLKSLHLEGKLTLVPALYHLTLVTLQYCPITALQLHSVSGMLGEYRLPKSSIAEDIASALPALSHLTIINTDMQKPSLSDFLSKLPNLAHLVIEPPPHSKKLTIPLTSRDNLRLDALTELRVSWSQLAVFLKQPDFLAHLERLYITAPMRVLCGPSILDDLAPLARYPAPAQMQIKLTQFNLMTGVIWGMEKCIDIALGLPDKWRGVFGRVTELVLVQTYQPQLHNIPVFRRWLALFPAVRRVEWDECSSDEFQEVFSKGALYPGADEPLTTEPSPFMNIPDDIIISILEFLPDDLFDMALVCRRLNYLASHALLTAPRLWNRSTASCTIKLDVYPAARDMLAALQVALVLPEIKELRVHIPRTGHIYPTINHLRRLVRILRRLDSLESVSLHFGVAFKPQLEQHHVTLQYRWTELFQSLLNIIVKKETCTALHVHGSPYLFPDEIRWNQLHTNNVWKRVRLVLPPPLKLTTFSFDPAALLSPIFEPWTVAALQSSQISTLRLDVTTEDYRFVEIVSQTLLTLHGLEINWHIAPEKNLRIMTLLARLPELQTLRMSSVFADLPATQAIPLSVPQLPQLTTLAASIPYINYLLKYVAPRALPALTELEISTCLTSTAKPPLSPLGSLAAVFEGLERHHLAPRITLAVTFSTTWDANAHWPSAAFDLVLGVEWMRTEWISTVGAVSVCVVVPRIRIAWARPDANVPYLAFLRERLGLFDALREVRFVDGLEYHNEEESRATEGSVLAVVKAAHAGVERVVVNGRSFEVGSQNV
ncbi:hypothetical protein HMN09_00216500 [Mycena chlorophos]|uniref:F-box domain-containing protein n=1 Tax=Mycena chlorophos TaxID=658473 RepID=A0A8H6WIF8_MYCCL|nr:hypothetical protein HMN09_00216500 [Mycena chlorophos]